MHDKCITRSLPHTSTNLFLGASWYFLFKTYIYKKRGGETVLCVKRIQSKTLPGNLAAMVKRSLVSSSKERRDKNRSIRAAWQ